MKKDTYVKESYGLYIDGQWRGASDGGVFQVTCPADGSRLSTCAEATQADVDAAVVAAWQAFGEWRKISPAQRSAILNQIADRIEANAAHLAMVESLDSGKPIAQTLSGDIPEAIEHFRYFAGVIQGEEGSATMLSEDMLSIVLREPIGVVGQIVPWNFPFSIGAWKIAPALAAGCCIVFKPSSSTSLSVLEFARLVEDILPPGVFNVITGSGSRSGEYMLHHPSIRKLSFTGSTEIGRHVALVAAERLVPATLELGGKSANIFFADCNWEKALDGLMMGIRYNQGQVCCAGSRIFVQDSIYDRFLADATKKFEAVKVGMPWDESALLGPLVYEGHLQDVLRYVEIGVGEGARLLCGGKRLCEGEFAKGCFMRPTILADARNDMRIAQEEIFGPVATVIPFHTEEEVIALANQSPYGLGGGVWTQDINRALRVARAIETGRMWVNNYGACPAGAPFGGYKESGIGRETHKMTLAHYSQVKNIMISLSEAPEGYF